MEGENKMMKYMCGKIIYTNSMDKKSICKLSRQQPIDLLLKKENKAIPKPHRSIKQMV